MSKASDRTKIGVIQMRCSPQPAENLARATEFVRAAAARGARIICLPELFRSRYFCQSEDFANFALAEEIPGPSTRALCELARELDSVIVAPLFEKRAEGIYHNSSATIDADGTYLGIYRKMHIPDDPLYYEKFYFTPGDLGFRAWNTRHGPIGVCICWDQWFPEAARLTAMRGAELIFYPTAIGWHPAGKEKSGAREHDAWETMQRSHAIANGCYVAVSNRTGFESADSGPGIEFWGQSFICDPFGQILAKAAADREEILVCDVDFSKVDDQRIRWPFFRDRRIDAYQDLTRRYLD